MLTSSLSEGKLIREENDGQRGGCETLVSLQKLAVKCMQLVREVSLVHRNYI